jgi:hypothetical protein
MSTIDDLEERNAVFAREAFSPKDSLMPALKTIVISCVDPRVDARGQTAGTPAAANAARARSICAAVGGVTSAQG